MVRLVPVLVLCTVVGCGATDAPTAQRSEHIASDSAASTTADESTTGGTTDASPTTAPPTPGSTDVGDAGSDRGEDGATDLGDPYFAGLGNGGYDVEHYSLALDVDADGAGFEASVSITARSLTDLASFSLDLRALDVAAVDVDGREADFSHDGNELRVSPAGVIEDGDRFAVDVQYGGEPSIVTDSPIGDTGWQSTGNVTWVMSEPNGASTWFPVNDHPSDKATFDVEVTVPDDLTAVANGVLVSSMPAGSGRRTWRWEMDQPMATYLAMVAIDEFEIVDGRAAGDTSIRDAIPVSQVDDPSLDGLAAKHGEMLAYFESVFGPYPFDVYGVVVIDEYIGLALETQSFSLFGLGLSDDLYFAHEVAHQWFGNSVTPTTWQDIWLNEGFATYAQWMWSDHAGDAPIGTAAAGAHAGARAGTNLLDLRDPGADRLFDLQLYDRGALALHALRLTVGDDTFFAILRQWTGRYRYGNASTDDFVALAEELSGERLDDFFDDWLGPHPPPPLPR